MSMKLGKGKGKQKIEMKKVEAYMDRMVMFSKCRSGIYKKMNETVTLCNVEAGFLIYSQAGKPYSFTNPSMEKMAVRLKNPSKPESSAKDDNNISGPLLEAYKKNYIQNVIKKNIKLLEELDMENKKAKLWKETRNEKETKKMWWNFTSEELSMEALELRQQPLVQLHDMLCEMLEKDGNGLSSGSGERHCGGDRA